ncbi:MAG: PIN domain-containing protein [Atopobiaceae bacterium]|nr:PIN domain-containing protein [Atopobiaceae bacterium]
MVKSNALLVDTNVWVGYFLAEEPHAEEVHRFFAEAQELGITLIYAPSTIKDVFYAIPRRMRLAAQKDGRDEDVSYLPAAWACVRKMAEIAVAASQSRAECDKAWMLRSTHGDFEDNLLMATAETCNADYVVTYDKRLLERFAPVCATPGQVLRLLEMGV